MTTSTATFFAGCSTVAEIKSLYKTLAFKYHPDHGGSTEMMQALNNAYEQALKDCDGKTVIGSDGKEHTYRWDAETEKTLIDMIDKLMSLQMENVEVDLIGLWIWVTGDTKPHKESLGKNGLGLSWHSTRLCWYFKPYAGRSWGSNASLEELAKTYGKVNANDLSKKSKKSKSKVLA